MPKFPIIIRFPNGQPFEGVVEAATPNLAIETAEKMGHNVDRDATMQLIEQDAGKPGSIANFAAILLALAGWLQLPIGLAAIVCAVIAVEQSRHRRGLPALVFAFITTIAGIAIMYLAATERHR